MPFFKATQHIYPKSYVLPSSPDKNLIYVSLHSVTSRGTCVVCSQGIIISADKKTSLRDGHALKFFSESIDREHLSCEQDRGETKSLCLGLQMLG